MLIQNHTLIFQMDHEDEEIEIPNYFICPISLDIMKDPVIAVSGITYDRESIDKWLEKVSSCPVTKQPLPSDSDLTPNHTLRRLIQHWCVENATLGVVRIPTPRVPPGKPNVVEEIKNLKKFGDEGIVSGFWITRFGQVISVLGLMWQNFSLVFLVNFHFSKN